MVSRAGSQPVMENVSRSPPSWPFQLVRPSKKCFPGATLGGSRLQNGVSLLWLLKSIKPLSGLSAKISSGAPAARAPACSFTPSSRYVVLWRRGEVVGASSAFMASHAQLALLTSLACPHGLAKRMGRDTATKGHARVRARQPGTYASALPQSANVVLQPEPLDRRVIAQTASFLPAWIWLSSMRSARCATSHPSC